MANLIQNIGTTVLVHIRPLLILLQNASNWRYLSDDTERILVQVSEHGAWIAHFFGLTVRFDIPKSLSKMAILVIQKDKVNEVVSGHASLIDTRRIPKVMDDVAPEVGDFLPFFDNPVSEALFCRSLNILLATMCSV